MVEIIQEIQGFRWPALFSYWVGSLLWSLHKAPITRLSHFRQKEDWSIHPNLPKKRNGNTTYNCVPKHLYSTSFFRKYTLLCSQKCNSLECVDAWSVCLHPTALESFFRFLVLLLWKLQKKRTVKNLLKSWLSWKKILAVIWQHFLLIYSRMHLKSMVGLTCSIQIILAKSVKWRLKNKTSS